MNVKKFSDAMSEIDSRYIDEALSYNEKPNRSRHTHRVSVVMAAALLAMFLIGCAVVAADMFGTQLLDFFTSQNESGFDLEFAIEKVSIDDLTGEIRKAGDIIRQQFEESKLYDSWYPGLWQTTFSTRDKACEYIGFDRLKRLDWDFEEEKTTLDVMGNEQGQILSVNVETWYSIDDMNVQSFSWIYTENYNEEFTHGTRFSENVGFREQFYTTDNNKQCHIISSSALESGRMCIDGYIVDEGVLYNLHIAYEAKDSVRAMDLMYQWADLL